MAEAGQWWPSEVTEQKAAASCSSSPSSITLLQRMIPLSVPLTDSATTTKIQEPCDEL